MSVQVPPHPAWVADLDAALDPSREAILDTRVIVDASENQLADGRIQNFLVSFYPIIRAFPPVAGALARPVAGGRKAVLPGQHPGGEAARRDVASDGRRL